MVLLVGVAACVASTPGARVIAKSTATELTASIVDDSPERHAHPVRVSTRALRELLVGSGRFVESEIGSLAQPMVDALSKLDPTESLRLSRDAGAYLIYARAGALVLTPAGASPRSELASTAVEPTVGADSGTPSHGGSAAVPLPTADEKALIAEGVLNRERNRDADALELFQRAYALGQSPEALSQMSLAEMALGYWVSAETHLQSALEHRRDPWVAGHYPPLVDALKKIQEHLGWLEVVVNVPGASVLVDGREVASSPVRGALRVPIGTPSVEIRAPGYHPMSRSIIVKPGSRVREAFELIPRR